MKVLKRRSLLRLATVATATLMLAAPTSAGSDPPLPAKALVTKTLDEMWRADSSHATMMMSVEKERGTRELSLESWSIGKDLALIVIRAPAREAGTATLRTDEGLWSYAPRADRLIRIPTGLLSEAWMGSHFSNDDLVRESSYAEDYNSSLSWTHEGGRRLLKLTLTPKPKAPVIYDRVEFFLDWDRVVPVRAEYHDRGRLMRKMNFDDVREVDGKLVPHRMELIPLDRKHRGERTIMKYQRLEMNVKVDRALFTKQGLRRTAKRR